MSTTASPLPAGLQVRLDPDVLVRDGGRVLCGGTPFRLIQLTAAGAAVLARWQAGEPIDDALDQARLARRLLDAGVLLTAGSTTAAPPGAIVVPAQDRVPELERCLRALADAYHDAQLVVVDDASMAGEGVAAIARANGATLIRHDTPRGPSAARNTGLRATTSPLVAFVDSDVVVGPGCLERLATHFADPAVGAAAPRVLALDPGTTQLPRYDAAHSSLDMGARPASAAPGRRIPYVPSTTLVIRRAAMPPGGFAEDLHIGEDVDLVWRMHRAGWRIAYDPEASVRHDHRTRPAAFWRRRLTYARSIGLLALRHPDALPALRVEPWSTAIVLLVAVRRPGLATLVAAGHWRAIHRVLATRNDRPGALACVLLARSLTGAGRGLSHAVRRAWSPALLLAAPRSRSARIALIMATAVHALDEPDRLRWLPLTLADDLVAGLGTWIGCLTARTARPLLPARATRSRQTGLAPYASLVE